MTTPNNLSYFTVFGHWDQIDDAAPGGTSSALRVLNFSAFVHFHPRIPSDFVLYLSSLSDPEGPEDTGVELSPIVGRIVGGDLCTINMNDTEGVQLVAATPLVLNALQQQGIDDLIYDVQFTDVMMNGQPQNIRNFGFAASRSTSAITITSPGLERLEYRGPRG